MSYIEPNELIFYNDNENGIHSGGFSVNSLFMKAGMSPIMTLNHNKSGGSDEQVSDLFNDLVVPNWAFFSTGGKKENIIDENDTDDDDVIDEDLHEKLLDLVREEKSKNETKHKNTKKVFKINKNKKSKKNMKKKM